MGWDLAAGFPACAVSGFDMRASDGAPKQWLCKLLQLFSEASASHQLVKLRNRKQMGLIM